MYTKFFFAAFFRTTISRDHFIFLQMSLLCKHLNISLLWPSAIILIGTNLLRSYWQFISLLLERFSNDCRKTKTKAITPTIHWLKNWRGSFKPITKRGNRNHVITFDSHLKTALSISIKFVDCRFVLYQILSPVSLPHRHGTILSSAAKPFKRYIATSPPIN